MNESIGILFILVPALAIVALGFAVGALIEVRRLREAMFKEERFRNNRIERETRQRL
jgi:hypothetical protein